MALTASAVEVVQPGGRILVEGVADLAVEAALARQLGGDAHHLRPDLVLQAHASLAVHAQLLVGGVDAGAVLCGASGEPKKKKMGAGAQER